MPTAKFRENRAPFPLTELAKYQGQWIAFDPEGTKVVAAAPTVGAVHQRVIEAGYEPEQVSFEGVPGPDDFQDLDNGEISSCCNSLRRGTAGRPCPVDVAARSNLPVASVLGVTPLPDKSHRIRWRGRGYPIEYPEVSLTLADDNSTNRWLALVTFSGAPLPYPILGNNGCLQYFDTRFLGAERTVELEPNWTYRGSK